MIKVFSSAKTARLERRILNKLEQKAFANFPRVKKVEKYEGKDGLVMTRLGNSLAYYHE